MQNNKTKFIFFGTGNFAAKVLDCLYQRDFNPVLIITTPDKPKGRKLELQPNPVKLWAQKNNKIVRQPEDLNEIRELLVGAYDVFVIADYGRIIPRHILNIPSHGCLNIHPSLLPKFRGSSPIQSFVLSGEQKTGVTIILMDEDIDHGPIVAQRQLEFSIFPPKADPPLADNFQFSNYKELEEKLAELGGQLLIEILPKWIEGKIKPQEQNHSQATYTKKIAKEDGLINLNDSPEKILKKIRAFTPWPGAYFFVYPPKCKAFGGQNNKKIRIIITEAELKNGKLIIKRIKPEGKNEMNFEDFLRGHPYLSINGTKTKPG